MTPCSMASAASCASVTRLPRTSWVLTSSPRVRAYSGPGWGIHATGVESQSVMRSQAVAGASGRSKARGCVEMRKTAVRLCQGRPTRRGPLSCSVSHSAAASCWGAPLWTAYRSRVAASSISGRPAQRGGGSRLGETCSYEVVDRLAEADRPLPAQLLHARGHVVGEGNGRAHSSSLAHQDAVIDVSRCVTRGYEGG